jgi:glucuronoxylan 4-O-methyltransferase
MILTKGKQMAEEEYRYIASLLGNKNFLVFGTGLDSKIWRYANKNGLTIFLEDNHKWINPADNDVYKITYSTKLTQADEMLLEFKNNNTKKLEINLPNVVKNTNWDLILVDAPAGNKDYFPGRMQSIYAASILRNKDTEVLVHDCDRYVEDVFSKIMLKNLHKQFVKLRSYKY